MKKIVLSSIVAMGLVSALSADVTVYGKVNLFLDAYSPSVGDSTSTLKSDASRFGVKGSTKLDDGLTAIYQWEAGIDYAVHDSQIKNRNTFVGLKGCLGTVVAGISDTPMKQAQGKVDLFNDVHDMKNVIGENLVKTEIRADKVVEYVSPKVNNIQFKLATAATDFDGTEAEKLGKAISTSLVYGDKKLKKSAYYAAIAYDTDVAGKDKDAIRLVFSTKVNDLTLGFLAEQASAEGYDDQNSYLVSAAYKIGRNTLKLQYATADEAKKDDGTITAQSRKQTSFGVDHKIGKHTKLFFVATDYDVDGGNTEDYKRYSAGIEHKFSTKF